MKKLPFVLIASCLAFAAHARAQDSQLAPLPAPSSPPASEPAPLPPPAPSAAPASPEPSTPAQPTPPVVAYHAAPSPMEAPPPADADEATTGGAPKANDGGFQMAIRTGVMFPMGSATGVAGDDMSKSFGSQFPIFVDLGGKVSPHVFIGGYGAAAFGSIGSAGSGACDQSGVSCSSSGYRLGLEVQYHFAPDQAVNPWIGYGIGYEWSNVSVSGPGASGQNVDATLNVSGLELARFMVGFDYRASEGFGIGPYAELSLAQFGHGTETLNGQSSDGDITNTALHEWATIGVRAVFMP